MSVNLSKVSYNPMVELDRAGRDELHYAAGSDDVDEVTARLRAGVDVDLVEKSMGYRPLQFAVQNGAVRAATALLDAGSKVNMLDVNGASPLHLAVDEWRRSPNGEMIRLLIARGADKSATDKNAWTPAESSKGQRNFPSELSELLKP